MPRYIDADSLIEAIKSELWDWQTLDDITATSVLEQTISDIQNAPTADVVELEGSKVGKYLSYTTTGIPTADVRENVHAHWEIVYDEDCDYNGGGKYICGNCRHAFSFGAYFELCRFDYCPNCGAQMDEEEPETPEEDWHRDEWRDEWDERGDDD